MSSFKDLVSSVAQATGETKATTERVLRSAFQIIPELAKEEGLNLSGIGFGVFKHKTRAARSGRNPQTGEVIQIAETTSLAFKASKSSK